MLPKIDLKPLRTNARNTHFYAAESNKDYVIDKVTGYASLIEAVYHVFKKRNGDVILRGAGKKQLKAFYCEYQNSMRFGFGASEQEKEFMINNCSWAKWN